MINFKLHGFTWLPAVTFNDDHVARLIIRFVCVNSRCSLTKRCSRKQQGDKHHQHSGFGLHNKQMFSGFNYNRCLTEEMEKRGFPKDVSGKEPAYKTGAQITEL